MHESIPKNGTHIWVLVDLSNSNPRSRNYLWWFETRDLARAYRQRHVSTAKYARLSQPIKMYVEGTR